MKRFFFAILSLGVLVALLSLVNVTRQASGAVGSSAGSSESLENTDQHGPPWLDEAWHYRRAIVINSEAGLPYYQVLISLNQANFPSFLLTNPDGSDIRFTHSDGTTLLNYWIETWDKSAETAYIWVKVPGLASGETVIYLYYNNPNAEPISNGVTTFDGFDDDWSQFGEAAEHPEAMSVLLPNSIEAPLIWTVVSGTPQVDPPGFLTLNSGTGISSQSSYRYQAAGYRAKFGLGMGGEWGGFINGASGQRTMIGDISSADEMYLINYISAPNNTLLEGGPWHNAFHVYEVRWSTGRSEGDIDHGISNRSSTSQVPGVYLPVSLFSKTGSNAALIVDWVYLRQYHYPEPTAVVEAEQGLVELNMEMADTPDPLRPGVGLTYQLSIFNTSDINAPGVVVTNTLPANVQIGPISPSQGSCESGGVFRCDLDTILANSMASITVIITPTMEGVITNTAEAASPGFEWNLSDNYAEEGTFVDATPPIVNWEEPTHNSGTYVTYGGAVNLEASGTDNDQVASLEFMYYDHLGSGWTPIGGDTTYPYQVSMDSDVLAPDELYLFAVVGIDRAGNQSDPYNPLRIIYIERRNASFLPVVVK